MWVWPDGSVTGSVDQAELARLRAAQDEVGTDDTTKTDDDTTESAPPKTSTRRSGK